MASGKLDTPAFKRLLTADLLRLNQLFTSEGYTLRLVGGVVRDLLLGQDAKDIDLATECNPDEMLRLLEREGIRHIPTGLQHGTITAHMNGIDYEITTLRIDRLTDGRHAVVEYTQDWRLDAERRDLTINAMSLELNGTLHDYYDGQHHLAERKIRFVGNAQTRIKEDYLRILRYFRFFGRISKSPDTHDEDTLADIRETAIGLADISVERIWTEIKRILIGNYAPELLKLMYELGVAKYISLPDDGNLHELSIVWNRMYNQYYLEPVSLLVTLVHSTKEAEELARKWKLSNAERLLGMFVTTYRDTCYKGTPLKYFQDLLVDGNLIEHVTEVLKYCGRIHEADEIRNWNVPQLPLTGKDLKIAGVKAGPDMGKILKLSKEEWKESFYSMSKEELLEVALRLYKK